MVCKNTYHGLTDCEWLWWITYASCLASPVLPLHWLLPPPPHFSHYLFFFFFLSYSVDATVDSNSNCMRLKVSSSHLHTHANKLSGDMMSWHRKLHQVPESSPEYPPTVRSYSAPYDGVRQHHRRLCHRLLRHMMEVRQHHRLNHRRDHRLEIPLTDIRWNPRRRWVWCWWFCKFW